jgi:Ca2+-dependent lipid-binding protein
MSGADDERSGMLIVNVKSASNLRNADGGLFSFSGKSDPFVVVTVPSETSEAHREETKVVNDTLDPEWNEQMEFAITQPRSIQGSIRVEVFDSDVSGSSSLGFIEVPWPFWKKGEDTFPCGKPVSQDLKSEADQPKASGKIDCDLEWRPFLAKPVAKGTAEKSAERAPLSAERSGVLVVDVKAASNLRDADTGWFSSGKSDTFVVVTVPSETSEAHREETKVINDSLNPEWNEQFEFMITQPHSTQGAIRLEVFDSDVSGNTPLGYVEVPWPF